MNAYELAKALKDYYEEVSEEFSGFGFLRESASLISQQADRIAELEKLLEEMKYEKSSGVYDVSNKPVAWINRFMDDGWLSWDKDTTADVATPLYTHPVKQLSDEDISRIYHSENRLSPQGNFAYYGFARAIIKEITE